ncbi:hypothetical protein P5P81_05600 [Tritonibacter mobilis]|nr:hypothetical protein [Tritonibacter mobilis]
MAQTWENNMLQDTMTAMDRKTLKYLDDSLVIHSDEILERSVAGPDDIVILSGTLVEGIGNAHSDLDVYVIGDDLPTAESVGERNYLEVVDGKVRAYYDYLPTGSFGFDVEYYSKSELTEMLAQVDDLYARSLKSTKILRQTLVYTVMDALHKVHVGECLCNEHRLRGLVPEDSWRKLSFVLYRNKIGGYPEFKDIMGAWKSGDFDTALENARTYLLRQAGALCHLTGSTNAKPKWALQMLKRVPSNLAPLSDDILTWLWKGFETPEKKREGVLEACGLIERIYRESNAYLDQATGIGFSCAQALTLTEREYQREAFKDQQTGQEFEHRRRLFSAEGRDLRAFFLDCA